MDFLRSLGTIQSGATFISYSAPQVALNIVFAFVLASLSALVYQFTHKGYSYSKNYVTSLIIVSLVATLVMMVIGNSLARAFALLGAFSIIRFRTAVKDVKDISFVFLSLVIGMAAGTNNYIIGIVGTILILMFIIILDRINITGAEKTQYSLSVFVKDGKKNMDFDFMNKYLKTKNLINVATRDNGRIVEYLFAIDLKKGISFQKLLSELNSNPRVERVNLFSTKEEIEY